uniref:WAP four-disulfide core domain 2 n=1 Tax=Sinocyclocheilus rhinocerous TaxID=307959 RepID=A0A673J4X5_9TELE
HLSKVAKISLSCICITAKPGVCPRRKFGAGMCAEFCVNDSDCPNNEKCCSNGCGHECMAPYTVVGHCPAKLTVVPSSRGCVSDKDCSGGHKCCVFDCGAVCVPPAFTKPGVCPRRKFGAGMCAEFCVNDSDCPNNEKCCSNGCGHECMTQGGFTK